MAETSEPSCCPAGSAGYLAADYATAGAFASFGEGAAKVDCYVSGDAAARRAVILAPDVWGWNSGRTRALADAFAARGFFALVPKVLDVGGGLEGGTDGDGLPPGFDMAGRRADFMEWIKKHPHAGHLDAKIGSLLAGIAAEKVAGVGFCWGGYFVAHLAAAGGARVSSIASAHPSIQIAGVHGEYAAALCRAVACPSLLLPAGNDDKALYGEEGSLVAALKEGNAASAMRVFPDVTHGWTTRGDITDAAVARDTQIALDLMLDFTEKHSAV